MPYISSKDDRREKLRNGEPALTAGELNYQIFYYVKHLPLYNHSIDKKQQIEKYIRNFLGDKPNYQKYNDLTGALIRCQREIERRIPGKYDVECLLLEILNSYDDEIANYEDIKIITNGDVEW